MTMHDDSEKPVVVPEESVAMRVVCCILVMIAVSCSFIFGKSPVPTVEFSPGDTALIVLSIWMAIGGCMFSYHYRHNVPRGVNLMLQIGAIAISLNLARELWMGNLHSSQFEFNYPLVNALTATSVISCFELRARKDILATSAFGMTLIALAGLSGRSILFGACVLLYIFFGAVLLWLCARSQTRELTAIDRRLSKFTTRGRSLTALTLSILCLPVLSLAAFSFVPRADRQADNIVSMVRAATTKFLFDHGVNRKDSVPLQEVSPNAKAKKPTGKTGFDPGKTGDKKPDAASDKDKDKNKDKGKNKDQDKSKSGTDKQPNKNGDKPTKPGNRDPKAGTQPLIKTPNRNAPKSQKMAFADHRGRHTGKQQTPDGIGGPGGPNKSNQPPSLTPRSQKTGPGGTSPNPTTPPPGASPPPGTSPPASQSPTNANQNGSPDKPPVSAPDKKPAVKDPAGSGEQTNSKPGEKTIKKKDGKSTSAAQPKPSAKDQSEGVPLSASSDSHAPKKGLTGYGLSSDNAISLDESMVRSEARLFTVACNRNIYTRMACFDFFDGRQWKRSDPVTPWTFEPTVNGTTFENCSALKVSSAVPLAELTENFETKADLGRCVPVGGVPRSLTLLSNISVDSCGTLFANPPIQANTKFTAKCAWPAYSLDQLRQTDSFADSNDYAVQPFLQTPPDQPDRDVQLALSLVEGGKNRFVQAEKIVSFLRQTCKYTMDATSSKDPNLVDEFLFSRKSGDCKAFASGFIMLCRNAGIPSRFVAGFTPGDPDPISGTSVVKLKHGHAWAEIYMEPYGWIPIDPTPGGTLPSRLEQSYYNYSEAKKAATSSSNKSVGSAFTVVETGLTYAGYAFAIVALLIAGIATILSLKTIRQITKQISSVFRYEHPATRMRNRVIKGLKRLGIERAPADTSRELLEKLQSVLNESTGTPEESQNLQRSVREFFETYNAVRYGNADELDRLKAIMLSIEFQTKGAKPPTKQLSRSRR